mgnify:CR=1 FL=1
MHTFTRSSVRSLLVLLVAGGLMVGLSAPAQAQLGVAGGLNFSSDDDLELQSRQETISNSTGYHVGLVYDLGLGALSLRPGIFYRHVGSYDFGNISAGGSESLNLSAIEVPIDARLTVLPLPFIDPYLMAGPKLTIPRGEEEFSDATEDLSLTANVGFGFAITVPKLPIELQPEVRYEFGTTNYIEDEFEIGDQTFSPEDPKFSTFSIRLNIVSRSMDDDDDDDDDDDE